jgi:hypothetical protein
VGVRELEIMMLIFDRVLHFPSALADAIDEQSRLFDACLEASRAGDRVKCRQLAIELEKANQRCRESTPPPELR